MQMERSSTHSAATTVSLWFWGWKSQYPRGTTWHSCSSGHILLGNAGAHRPYPPPVLRHRAQQKPAPAARRRRRPQERTPAVVCSNAVVVYS
jgi:hypothetical protein